MKVALLMSGHLRTFKRCYPSLYKYFLDQYQADVFIHTWDRTDANPIGHRDDITHTPIRKVDQDQIDQLETIYRAKTVVVEHQDLLNDEAKQLPNPDIQYSSMKAMHYGKLQVVECFESFARDSGTHYDVCVTLRPDIRLKTNLDLSMLDPNRLNFAIQDNHSKVVSFADPHHMHMADIITVSAPNNIATLMREWFNSFDEVYGVGSEIVKSDALMLSEICEKHQIEWAPFSYFHDRDWSIARSYRRYYERIGRGELYPLIKDAYHRLRRRMPG